MRLGFPITASFVLLTGCGAKPAPAPPSPLSGTTTEPARDAGSAAPASTLPDRPMPAVSTMPNPNVARSTRAVITRDEATKKRSMKGFGQLFRSSLDERGAAAVSRVRLESGHCYRAMATAGGSASSVVLVLRDSAGAKITESAVLQLPAEANDYVCANVTDDAELLVSVGRGKGEISVKWESD